MKLQGYRDRQVVLLAMGFRSYRAYLASELWATIRAAVIERDPKCRVCTNRRASQAHHLDYHRETLEGRRNHRILGICGGCHQRVEFKGGKPHPEKKRDVSDVERKTFQAIERWKYKNARSEFSDEFQGPPTRHGGFFSEPGRGFAPKRYREASKQRKKRKNKRQRRAIAPKGKRLPYWTPMNTTHRVLDVRGLAVEFDRDRFFSTGTTPRLVR